MTGIESFWKYLKRKRWFTFGGLTKIKNDQIWNKWIEFITPIRAHFVWLLCCFMLFSPLYRTWKCSKNKKLWTMLLKRSSMIVHEVHAQTLIGNMKYSEFLNSVWDQKDKTPVWCSTESHTELPLGRLFGSRQNGNKCPHCRWGVTCGEQHLED